MKIEYHKGDLIGPYNVIFLHETEQDTQPCGRKNRRAQFLCPYCKTNEFNARISEVKRGKTRSCGCYRSISKLQTHAKDIKNERHEHLVAIKRTDEHAKDNSYLWLCQCDCGNYTKLTTSEFYKTNSCGCQKGFTQGEQKVLDFLQKHLINYVREYSFKDCLSDKGFLLRFDFYLPDYNCCIEIDGRQHREIVSRFGGEKAFIQLQNNDKIKNEYCNLNNIHLIRIPYERGSLDITEQRLEEIFIKEGILSYE